MGSGNSGSYNGTKGGSQPYAETYHVYPKAMAIDKTDADIYDPQTGYFHNPTAIKLEDSIQNDRVFVDGRRQEGMLTYVMDKDGKIIIAKRSNPNNSKGRAPHPTLIGGKDPQVQCAGMIHFRKGRIVSVDTNSGHFRPDIRSLAKVKTALQALYDKHPDLFDPSSEWRIRK